MLEFVLMLVIAVVLALALLSFSGVISDEGERMIRLVRFSVP
jgi:hypothetical protein